MTDPKHSLRGRLPAIANDTPTAMNKALRRWAQEQLLLRAGLKAFLMHLADHADEQARVSVLSRYFQNLMNLSSRTVTCYLRELEAEQLITATGDFIRVPGGSLAIYRLAPGEAEIDLLVESPPARLVPALEAMPREMLDEFRDMFGGDAVFEYLVGSMVCPATGTLKPKSETARSFLAVEANEFFLEWGGLVGEVAKVRADR
jgi:hypothetical protein